MDNWEVSMSGRLLEWVTEFPQTYRYVPSREGGSFAARSLSEIARELDQTSPSEEKFSFKSEMHIDELIYPGRYKFS